MGCNVEINEREPQPTVSIRKRTTIEGLPKLIGESYAKIYEYLTELGETPVSAPFTAYHNMDMQDLDVEMGFPVARTLPSKDDIVAGEISAGLVVSCMHIGPYSAMERVYGEMSEWIAKNGYQPTGVSYEYYFNSPEEVPESELMTRIDLPVTKR